ncbi:hypothetical protein T4A_4955 [Trichinella pseudospiralis]|uniref:Uncharacterized protein n=1 Tax=Trichinella pseudospiralis TaxID=6337 RepID=A0A0V1E212_TRIPS|nr:hypothetical protein T4A_4955 [Trichinella pseudospiralis]
MNQPTFILRSTFIRFKLRLLMKENKLEIVEIILTNVFALEKTSLHVFKSGTGGVLLISSAVFVQFHCRRSSVTANHDQCKSEEDHTSSGNGCSFHSSHLFRIDHINPTAQQQQAVITPTTVETAVLTVGRCEN